MTNKTSENNKRIAKNSLYMSIRMVVVLFISLYTTRAVLKVLGIEDYGIYNVVCGFVSMFSFLNNSMASATQRYYNYEHWADMTLEGIKQRLRDSNKLHE